MPQVRLGLSLPVEFGQTPAYLAQPPGRFRQVDLPRRLQGHGVGGRRKALEQLLPGPVPPPPPIRAPALEAGAPLGRLPAAPVLVAGELIEMSDYVRSRVDGFRHAASPFWRPAGRGPDVAPRD